MCIRDRGRGIAGVAVVSGIFACEDIETGTRHLGAVSYTHLDVYKRQIRTCVADGIRNGEDDKVDELVTMLQKLMK